MSALLNIKQFVRFDEHGNLHVPNKLFVACQAYVQTPLLNDNSSRVATTEWVRAQIVSLSGITLSETDPIWVFEKALYYTKVQADARYLQSFTETDPTVPAWAKTSVKPTYTFAELLSKPTTIAGYGITDIPTTLPASDVYAWAKAATKPSYAYSEITGLPTLFSGSYLDLTNKPTLFSGAYVDLTGKPTLFSGAYADLTGKPTIPTNTNELTNGAGFITSYTETDPIWTAEKINYYTKTAADIRYLQSYTETDPIWTSEKANYALKTYVDTSISNLVASAPAALNTLNELALALGSDANFSTTVTTLIGTKEPSITAGTTLQYWRGDKTWQTLPIYTLSGLGGEPIITAGTIAQYWRGDKTWQTLPSYSLPIASATVLGGIKVGSNLSINATTGVLDATFTYTLPTASTTVLGGVKVDGTTITINGSGIISGANTYSLPIASSTVLGGIKVGTNLSIDANGVLSSTDTNTTYVVFTRSANGLVPAAPTGTGTTKYLREDGTWVIPPDTDTVYVHPTTAGNKHIPAGGAAGQILRWSADGTAVWGADTDTDTWNANSKDVAGYVAAPGAVANKVWKTDANGNPAWRDDADTVYSLPIASATVLGGIKVGTNLSIDANGILSSTDTNTWNANSKDVAGYVAAPGAVANKVWKTDASGNPGWRDDADTDTNTTYTAGTGLTLTGTVFSVTKTITAVETADTIALRNASGQLVATGFYQASSRTLKTNINPFTRSALDIIREVAIVSFNYKTDIINKHIGFIAEDTPEELSTRNKNVMDSNNTIGLLLKAVQELEAKIKILESK